MTGNTWSATYVADVLRIYQAADLHDRLMWQVTPSGNIQFSATCSDTFWWGTADVEDIGPGDVGLLRRCLDDLRAAGDEDYLIGELFAARKRNMRPMRLWLKTVEDAATLGLFVAAGPERDPRSEG